MEEIDLLAEARARGTEMKRVLLEEAGGGWPASSVASHLGITRQAVEQRRSSGALLAVEVDGGQLFPACQFMEEGVIPHLLNALEAFQVDGSWTRLSVLLSETPMLPGIRVIDALRSGRVEEAIHGIRTYGEQGAL